MKFILIDENGDDAGTITTTDRECAERIAQNLFGDKATVRELPVSKEEKKP